jgi:dTDP-4-dehydrorhamnose 3,5-epimerase
MNFIPCDIPDVLIIEPKVFGDARGFFMETYQARRMAEAGISGNFVQDNQSRSARGVLRGLHYQVRQTQAKLVRVVSGSIFDVCVDLRRSSPTFKQWTGVELSAENKRQLWVPKGFAHGFYVLSESADLVYKTDDYYAPEWECTLKWDDPAIGVRWPVPTGEIPVVSAKDAQGKLLAECPLFD